MMSSLDTMAFAVALPTEGVDRNIVGVFPAPLKAVALPAEGVDRNIVTCHNVFSFVWSPSPRRAWIEIYCGRCSYQYEPVALPTEGADRNYGRNAITGNLIVVALPTEDVDRITARVARRASNSPHPDTLRPGKAAWRENCPAGWGHPALRGDKKSLCASNQTFPPHPARAAPPSPQGEGFSLRAPSKFFPPTT